MPNNKLILEQLLDIGGLATLNNFYSTDAKTYLGSLYNTRKKFKLLLDNELIKEIPTVGKTRFPTNEVFYCITKKGADFIGRQEYKYKGYPKSPYNIMHESMKFDFALAWLNFYGSRNTEIRYNQRFSSLMPDITITVNGKETHKFLIEIERKKTIDRTERAKFKIYNDMFYNMRNKKFDNPKNFTVLFVYTNTWYNVFARPQQYELLTNEIVTLHEKTRELAKLAKNLPDKYLFMPFPDFYRLNEKVWYTPDGNKFSLVI